MCEQGEFDMLNASYPAFKKLIPASDRLFVPERQYQMEGPHQTPRLSVGPLGNHIERVKESLWLDLSHFGLWECKLTCATDHPESYDKDAYIK